MTTTQQSKFNSKHRAALVSMLIGPVMVFSLILTMNQFIGKVDKTPAQEVTEIAMVKQIHEKGSKEIREAENLTRVEEEELRALRLKISADVRSWISQLRLSELSLQIFHQGLLQQAEKSLRISEVSYTQGEISLIDYLDSQRTYFSILNDYQDSLYQWNADKAALEKAIGEEIQ